LLDLAVSSKEQSWEEVKAIEQISQSHEDVATVPECVKHVFRVKRQIANDEASNYETHCAIYFSGHISQPAIGLESLTMENIFYIAREMKSYDNQLYLICIDLP
jgi:hypothetical protein